MKRPLLKFNSDFDEYTEKTVYYDIIVTPVRKMSLALI